MKTTTQAIATKKLLKSKVNKTTMAYQFVKEVIAGKKEIRPVYVSGSGRFTSNQDHTESTMLLLAELGIEFTKTNDSPRGGLTGNLITIITKIK